MMFLFHSAKGSTWEDHKYIKRLNGTYYYPDSYKGGRHLPSTSKKAKSRGQGNSDEDKNEETKEKSESSETTSTNTPLDIDELKEEDIATLATEVIRGNFGNGDVRKELLGKHYQQVQDRVNQILLGSSAGQPVSSPSNSAKKEAGERALKAVYDKLDKIDQRDSGSKKKSQGIDLAKVYSVYSKRSKK